MKIEVGDRVRCIESCKYFVNGHEIDVGAVCTVIREDPNDYFDIRVRDASGDEGWVNSDHFERVEVFKVGDIVSAKEPFVHDGKCVWANAKYSVAKVGTNSGIGIVLDDGNTWYVPSYKMRLVDETELNKDKAKGDTIMSTLKIKNVIFNDPATIVFWEDGVKTVVKCQKGDKFDPEKGLALAISKRVLGNNYIWHGRFMKWLPKQKKGEKK